jgi:tetratricopeptide (TPR) repeat protein
MRRTTIAASLWVFAAVAFQQHLPAQEDPHAHHSGAGWVPREILERPASLRDGVGRVHVTVTTSSREAQAFYGQGIAYLHSYVWIEAARSFNQALRHDSDLAMAYLGLSYAYSGLEDTDAANAMFAKARSLASRTSEGERNRIEIRARQLEAIREPGNVLKHLEYRKAIDAALAVRPDDAELWLLRGNAEEPHPAGRGQRGGAATIAFYEAALERVKDHFAAHHYLTHTYETIGNAARALKHGEVYARLAPAIPHAQHMFGHDLRRVGRIEEAINQFERTRALEEEYFRTEHIDPELDWHYAHNLSLLATAYQYQGRMKEAEVLLLRLFELPKYTAWYELWGREWPEFLLGRGRASDALAAANQMVKSKWPAVRCAAHSLAGSALLTLGRSAEAQAELAASERELGRIVAIGPLGVTSDMVRPFVDTLRAEMHLRAGTRNEGAAIFTEVARRVRAAPGADAWIQALYRLESMARVARDTDNWELAEYIARQMIEHDNSYAGAHFALALAHEHRRDFDLARTELNTAITLWRKADTDLVELRLARRKTR